jgi:branched-chain amino acid transport system permease protein
MISRSITFTRSQRQALLCGGAGLAWYVYVVAGGGYLVSVMGFAAIYAIMVTGLNVFMGNAGQISFGQNAFAAIGGYGSAVLTTSHGWDPALALLVMLGVSCLAAWLIGYPTLRLRGHYLAMATFALGMISYEISGQWRSVTQGYMGLPGIPPLGTAGFELTGDVEQLCYLTALAGVGIGFSVLLKRSRFGRALDAVAGSEDAARAIGISVARYKMAAFVIAAGYASVAGSLMAHFVGFISPEVFGPQMVLWCFFIVYLGGLGTIWGPALGAIVVSLLPEVFRGFKELQDLVYCGALILILIYAPNGLTDLGRRLFAGRRRA